MNIYILKFADIFLVCVCHVFAKY